MGGISYVLNKMIGRKRKQANSNSSTDRPLPYQSQCGQDRFVHERFFQDYPKGVFVDIGAYDGITCSNTHFFEHQLGWRGICVEPQQQLFARLTMERKCTCIRGCVSSEAGVGLFLEIDGLNMEAGLVKEYDPRHMKHIEAVIQRQQSSTNLIEVPCFRLDLLLEENDIQRIDYLSIDTEGGELKILQSLDFDRFPVHVITVENNYEVSDFHDYLGERGFEWVARLGVDEVFRNPNFVSVASL